MTISFFSNYLNIHQLPFCEEIIRHIGEDNFHFIASREMDADRVQMGFENMNLTKPFVVRSYESTEAFEKAKQLAIESDVVIIGSAPDVYQRLRLGVGKLTFRYNERLFKKRFVHYLDPRILMSCYNRFTRNRNNSLYVLCASAYTKRDLVKIGFPANKCFKWGYFPEMKNYPSCEKLFELKAERPSSSVSILWVARLIGWKHPEVAITVAKYLQKEGIPFSMKLIGDGPLYQSIKTVIIKNELENSVLLLGAQDHDVVLEEMEKADIFLFTSDKQEGWGAVLNEAMNAGCAIVADRSIGSVPFLIDDGVSGYTYKTGHFSEICFAVKKLALSDKERREMGREAWRSINMNWSIQTATNRLMGLIDSLSMGLVNPPVDGPCSFA